MTTREPGFYWVKLSTPSLPQDWFVAKWDGKGNYPQWEVCGRDDYFDDEALVIGPKIQEPT